MRITGDTSRRCSDPSHDRTVGGGGGMGEEQEEEEEEEKKEEDKGEGEEEGEEEEEVVERGGAAFFTYFSFVTAPLIGHQFNTIEGLKSISTHLILSLHSSGKNES